MNHSSQIKKKLITIGSVMIAAVLGLHASEILLDNTVIPQDAPAGTRIGIMTIPGDSDSSFELTDTGDFINSDIFSIPSIVNCTGGTSDTGGVSSTGGVSTTQDCENVYALNNSLFYIDGNELIASGALSFSQMLSFHVGINGTTEEESTQQIFRLSRRSTDPFSDAQALGDGWMESSWFGVYYQNPDSSWIYHESLGWIFLEIATDMLGAMFWQEDLGWVWIDNSLHPLLYQYSREGWIYYSPSASPTPFYDYNTQSWLGL